METEYVTSTVTSKSQTVIPKLVRARLGLKPGDCITYRMRGGRVEIARQQDQLGFGPFTTFTEWNSAADDHAFADLKPRD